jgi:hypothetical protein
MKFTVRNQDVAEEYEADDIYDLIDQLLEEWIAGDANMPGVFAFLADNGYAMDMTDDEVDEGTDESILRTAADAVRIVLHAGDSETLAVFLSAISSEYQIEGPDGEPTSDLSEEYERSDDKSELDDDEAADLERRMDEDYDY